MRHLVWTVPLFLVLSSCKFKNETRLISINPDYAYTDGCTNITLSGSNLGTTGTASIGDNAVIDLAPAANDPELPQHAQSVGFVYTGLTPKASSSEGGFVDVSFTLNGETKTLDRAFYYIVCPDTFQVDMTGEAEMNAPGDGITVSGCGLDDDDAEAVFYSTVNGAEVQTAPLQSDCNGAEVSFIVPNLADGDYYLQIRDNNGTTYGDTCVEADPDTDTDTQAADPCAELDLIFFTVAGGGAR